MEVVGIFENLETAGHAVKDLIRAHVPEEDITSLTAVPYPEGVLVHEKDTRSHLQWFALGGGIAGALTGFGLAAGTAWLYPLFTGDKPIVSLFPVGIITYEFTMLFAILGTVFGMFIEMGLPGFLFRVQAPEVTEGMVGISVLCSTADERGRIRELLLKAGATRVRTGGVRK